MTTLKDVAERAGVSTATVSYVLNNKQDKVSEEVFARVKLAAEELNYQPNMVARALRAKKLNVIGVISEDITTFQVNNIVKGINKIADLDKYQIIQTDLNLNDKIWNGSFQDYSKVFHYKNEIQEKLKIFKAAGVGSVIYVSMHDRNMTGLFETDIPLVYAYCYTNNKEDITVYSDNMDISCEIVNAMIDKGHKIIGLISGPMDSIPAYKRMMGYYKAFMHSGVSVDTELIKYGNWSVKSGEIECEKLMKLENPPTAIFSMNDWMAIGAIKTLKKMGYRPGKDVEITGFDDIDYCEFVEPPLSSVRIPLEEIGKEAAKKAIMLMNKEPVQVSQEPLPCELVERETFKKID